MMLVSKYVNSASFSRLLIFANEFSFFIFEVARSFVIADALAIKILIHKRGNKK